MDDPEYFEPRPMHEGELLIQQRRGVMQEAREVNEMAHLSRILPSCGAILDYLPTSLVQPVLSPFSDVLFRSTRFVVLASVDSDRRVWAHIVYGEPGFFRARSAVQVSLAPQYRVDPLVTAHYVAEAPYATLTIDLESRKRFRVNGKIGAVAAPNVWTLNVEEALPNCPKKRVVKAIASAVNVSVLESPIVTSSHLTDEQVAQISNSDTFFIATCHHTAGLDVSHRGGKPGFVRVLSDRELMWPDYKGNTLYMSIGNLAVNPQAGLIFVNQETGSVLQLIGTVSIIFDDKLSLDLAPISLHFRIAVLQDRSHPVSLMPPRGTSATLIAVRDESGNGDVKTFRFRAEKPISPIPGQYVTLRLEINGVMMERTWTISSLSGSLPANEFEVSLKRKHKGVVSSYLHGQYQAGEPVQEVMRIEVVGIGGEFTPLAEAAGMLKTRGEAPLLLLAAGIGITPFVPLLRHLSSHSFAVSVALIISNKDYKNIPFLAEIMAMTASWPACFQIRLCVTQEAAPAPHHSGRLTADVITSFVPAVKKYVCGPEVFIQHSLALLTSLGVAPTSIFLERFDF